MRNRVYGGMKILDVLSPPKKRRSKHTRKIESESFYSVLLQTQETSAKTMYGRCRRGHLGKRYT